MHPLLALVLVASALPQDAPAPQARGRAASLPLAQMPPLEAWAPSSESSQGVAVTQPAHGRLQARVRARTDTRRVTVEWIWLPAQETAKGRLREKQEHCPDFWPTAAIGAGLDTVLVGGSTSDGRTVIERWRFDPAHHDPQRGTLAPVLLRAVEVVSDEDAAGRRHVLAMAAMHGSEGQRLLVQFADSKACWILDLAANTRTLVAAPEPPADSSALAVPALARAFKAISRRDHREHGHVYVFHEGACFDTGEHPTVILLDRDRDGTLDDHLALDERGWAELGFADPARYLD